jgi:hypothetical protein
MSAMNTEFEHCRRLRHLDEAIERERKIIADLKTRNRTTDREQEQLTELLSMLDETLRSGIVIGSLLTTNRLNARPRGPRLSRKE